MKSFSFTFSMAIMMAGLLVADAAELPLVTSASVELGGKQIGPGVLNLASVNIAGNLRLVFAGSPGDDPSANYDFQVEGTFTSAASSQMIFAKANGDDAVIYDPQENADNDEYNRLSEFVTWTTGAQITLGAESATAGSMTANGGIIEVGANARTGDLTAAVGAVDVGASSKCGHITVTTAALTIGAAVKTGNLWANAAITIGAAAVTANIDGQAAVDLGATAETEDITATAAITVGAACKTGDLSSGAAITVGAATGTGSITATAAITLSADAYCLENAAWSLPGCAAPQSGRRRQF